MTPPPIPLLYTGSPALLTPAQALVADQGLSSSNRSRFSFILFSFHDSLLSFPPHNFSSPFCVREPILPKRSRDLAAKIVWDSRAPLWCRFHSVLTSQALETIDHLPVAFVFARAIRPPVLTAWGREDWAPLGTDGLPASLVRFVVPGERRDLHTISVRKYGSIEMISSLTMHLRPLLLS